MIYIRAESLLSWWFLCALIGWNYALSVLPTHYDVYHGKSFDMEAVNITKIGKKRSRIHCAGG